MRMRGQGRMLLSAAAAAAGMVWAGSSMGQPAKGPDAPKDGVQSPAPRQPGSEGRGRGSRREPITRDELRERLKQRREELKGLEQKLDEAQQLVDTQGITDEEIARRIEAMRPSARWFLLGGFGGGEGREGRDPSRDGEDRGGGGDGGRPWGPRGDGTDWSKPVTDEDVTAAMGWVKQHMPRLAPRLEDLQRSDPEAFKRVVQRMRPRIAEMQRLAAESPESAQTRIADWQAGMRVVDASGKLRELKKASASEGDLNKARDEVRAALAEQFDAQLKLQESEIVRLKERTDRSQKRIEERRASRDQWLKERMEEIESGKEHGGRGTGGGGGGGGGDGPPQGKK